MSKVLASMGSASVSPVDVQSLISQLTLDEKISLIAGKNLWETAPVPRLGIPSLKFSDGPNGARGGEFQDGVRAACFPAGSSLAASWDRSIVERVGKALAEETKTKGALVLLGPTVCPHRHPLGGRNFESFSEDPLLAGVLATKYIEALQREGVGATIKHFAANEQESRRFTIDEAVSQRALREIYMKPFEIAVKNANPWAVMTSYNLVNGIHSDMNKFFLQTVLRDQWRWNGLVMSDWGGTNSTLESITAGLDLEMPGPGLHRTVEKITPLIKSGQLPMSDLDSRVHAVLDLLVKTGKFDNPDTPPEEAVDRPEHRQLIRKAGAQGIVLLKNENNVLPLKKDKLKSIAMLGLAKESLAHGGGSAAVNAHYKRTPWEAMTAALEGAVEMKYAQGASVYRNLPPLSSDIFDSDGNPGLTLKGYTSENKETPPDVSNVTKASRSPISGTVYKFVTVMGTFKPTVSGSHYLSFNAIGKTTIFIDDKPIFNLTGDGADAMAFLFGVATEEVIQYPFVAGESYQIRVESGGAANNNSGLSILDGCVGFNLGFMLQEDFEQDYIAPAVDAAKTSDVALVYVGHPPIWETEGTDRDTMSLPANGSLDRLITAVSKVNPNTVVINSTGSAISMPWLDSIAGLVQTWFPGQEAGNSITDVLLGTVCPSGKLPVTFPKSVEVCPAYGNFPGDLTTCKVKYEEGIYIGYRHFDKHPEDVLFPFGFGLSYTTFEVSNIQSQPSPQLSNSDKIKVRATVKNTGTSAGAEILQLYAGPAHSTLVDMPLKQLADFEKVTLQPGKAQEVSLCIGRDNIAYWAEENGSWVVEAGRYTAFVGTSSTCIHGTIDFEVPERMEFAP